MENIQPIKRSVQLAPLSREHHDGLLFAWKLKQGLANATPLDTLREYVQWYWNNHISKHFHDEENTLLKYFPPGNNLANQLKDEHNNIRELIISIDRHPDADTISILADFITRHIRFEERSLFSYLEENLTNQQLNDTLAHLEPEPACSVDWKQAFWERRKG